MKSGKDNGNDEKKRGFKHIFWSFLLVAGVGACVGVCILTGCFSEKQVEIIQSSQPQKEKNYTILIDQWNSAVRAADLNRSFELPRDGASKMLAKLNHFFTGVESYDQYVQKNSCVLHGSKTNYLPSQAYAEFLKEHTLPYKVHFTMEDTEEQIMQELKKVTNSKYIDYSMLEKIAFMHDFKLYFEKNKKKFHKEGFSEYLMDYETYKVALGKCKE